MCVVCRAEKYHSPSSTSSLAGCSASQRRFTRCLRHTASVISRGATGSIFSNGAQSVRISRRAYMPATATYDARAAFVVGVAWRHPRLTAAPASRSRDLRPAENSLCKLLTVLCQTVKRLGRKESHRRLVTSPVHDEWAWLVYDRNHTDQVICTGCRSDLWRYHR